MNKIISLILSIIIFFSVGGCANSAVNSGINHDKTLIERIKVFYSKVTQKL